MYSKTGGTDTIVHLLSLRVELEWAFVQKLGRNTINAYVILRCC